MTREQAVKYAEQYIASFVKTHVIPCYCGEWFVVNRRHSRYCSKACALQADKYNKRRLWHLHKSKVGKAA